MFLVDTNIWLELLLDQERAAEVRRFLEVHEASQLAITEFSLYSMGIVLTRLNRHEVFTDFLADTLEHSRVRLIRLDVAGLKEVMDVQRRFELDFDDAYQYVAASQHNLTLLSFDRDFDRTELGKKTPAEVLASSGSSTTSEAQASDQRPVARRKRVIHQEVAQEKAAAPQPEAGAGGPKRGQRRIWQGNLTG